MQTTAPYLRLRKALTPSLPAPIWPEGITLTTLAQTPPEPVHALLRATFRAFPKPCDAWLTGLTADPEYLPELALVASDEKGGVAGYIQSWSSGFIKDLAVAPHLRRQGLATALMLDTFARFSASGHSAVDLKVERKNKPAQKFYAGLGMFEVLD
jgi:ribosomal protein S18 acetylase RimI-like enzyme